MSDRNFDIQNLSRICNETLILAVLAKQKAHGYQIAAMTETMSQSRLMLNLGTIYPVLHKLEKDGYIKGCWERETSQRDRKFYRITTKGKKYLKQRTEEWKVFTGIMLNRILGEEEHE
ncbi:MAG: helix-turn-helix transcriptional regulator [Candidatus Delongbacteria bacterium]|nr:helix-turn-helix transcriptional regulator [Candidatus Delongbacteria bacterium]